MVEAKGEGYPLARDWNKFVKLIEKARETWEELQETIYIVGDREIEERYSGMAQKRLNQFRKVKFEWMISMFVEYYRGAGGLEEMYIILPPETKKEKEISDDSKSD